MASYGVSITRELVQSVRDAVDIVDIASDMTSLKRQGRRHQGLCPFHKEKSPSFSVDADAGLYYCFGCGAGGDAIRLYMEHSGDDFPAAIEALARRYGIPLPAARPGGFGRQRQEGPDLTKALEAAATFFSQKLRHSDSARSYLAERKIDPELIEKYGLGYAPDDWRQLRQALGGRFPAADLLAAGLLGESERSNEPYDRFRNRLMFPIHAPNGRLVGFGGRTLGDDQAKYINTSETAEFHKGRLLYGFPQAKRSLRDTGRALLVEGYFDVIGAVACGLDTAVAGMGTALTPEQATLLGRYSEEVIVCYDGDAAGEKAFRRSLPLLLGAGLQVRRARFPEGHDPDSLRLEEGPEAVRELVESADDAITLELERLTPPPGKRSPAEISRAAKEMVEMLRPVRDEMTRRGYAQRAAENLGVPEDVFLQRLGPRLYHDAEPQRRRAREVTSTEERSLQLLLIADPPPLPEALPPEEIFLDAECRNIYAAFRALYKSGELRPPRIEEVLGQLDAEGAPESTIDRIARLVLEEKASSSDELEDALSKLVQRWHKRRQGDLVQQIRQAQEQGDTERLSQLLEEKNTLNRNLHPDMSGRWW